MDEPGIDLAVARQRLLDAADELFYRQGMHRVSIDQVIAKAASRRRHCAKRSAVPTSLSGLTCGSSQPVAGRDRARTPRLRHTP